MPTFVELTPEQVCTALVPLLEHKALTTVIPWGEITDKLNAILATAQPEQAKVLDFEKPGQISVNAPTCAKCGKNFLDCKCSQEQPRAASGGALSADIAASVLARMDKVGREIFLPRQEWQVELEKALKDELQAALAAHDQKVREQAFEEACKALCEQCHIAAPVRRIESAERGVYFWHDFGNLSRECDAAAIRALASRAEEKVSGATSAAKDGDAQ